MECGEKLNRKNQIQKENISNNQQLIRNKLKETTLVSSLMAAKCVKMDFKIRSLQEKDIPDLLDLFKSVNWNYTTEYINFLRMSSPRGCLVAIDNNNDVIGHCCCTKSDDKNGVIGLYVTHQRVRGSGVGLSLFHAGLIYLGNVNISLNSNPKNAIMYDHCGFKRSSLTMTGFEGQINRKAIRNISTDSNIQVVQLDTCNINSVLEYDEIINECPRSTIIKNWFKRPNMETLVAMKNDVIVGYACYIISRSTQFQFKIMPLYANEESVAQKLWVAVCSSVPDLCPVEVAMINENCDAVNLFRTTIIGKVNFQGVRMYTHSANYKNVEKVYSIRNYHNVTI